MLVAQNKFKIHQFFNKSKGGPECDICRTQHITKNKRGKEVYLSTPSYASLIVVDHEGNRLRHKKSGAAIFYTCALHLYALEVNGDIVL